MARASRVTWEPFAVSGGCGEARIDRAEAGNLGDCTPVGEGVSEMRIHHGPGYRVYFVQRGLEIIVLLGGGDKSTQSRDTASALELVKQL